MLIALALIFEQIWRYMNTFGRTHTVFSVYSHLGLLVSTIYLRLLEYFYSSELPLHEHEFPTYCTNDQLP